MGEDYWQRDQHVQTFWDRLVLGHEKASLAEAELEDEVREVTQGQVLLGLVASCTDFGSYSEWDGEPLKGGLWIESRLGSSL